MQPPVFSAIRDRRHDDLRRLASNPNLAAARDERGFTPLVLATYLGNLEATKILMDAGADPNQPDANGNTALMGVIYKGHEEIIRLLLDRGADPNIRGMNGMTALHYAMMFGKEHVADLLVTNGADPAVKDDRGLKPARLKPR